MGKSSSGKDTFYSRIKNEETLALKPIVLYTTRPIRDGEIEGDQYHFVDIKRFEELDRQGVIIEKRVYHTVHGDWWYFTVDDKDIDLNNSSYIAIGVLESYKEFKKYFGNEAIVPIFIEVDDGERLSRALKRELEPQNRKFEEMCRRFLADAEDFSEDKIIEAGISKENRFNNDDLDDCMNKVISYIKSQL